MTKLGGILSGGQFGGWEVIDNDASGLPQDLASGFGLVTEKLLGATYTPIKVLAKQLVNGYNYLTLAEKTVVSNKPEKSVVAMIINIPAGDIKGEKAGLVKIIEPEELEPEIQDGFEQVVGQIVGVNYRPIIVLGTQVVKGINYYVICEGKTLTATPDVFAAEVVLNLFEGKWSLAKFDRIG